MEIDPPPIAGKGQFKLRWYQYRLRSLFLVTFLVAIGMSYVAVTMQNQRKQKAAAVAIERAGGIVKCEKTWLGKLLRDDSLVNVTDVSLYGESISDAVMVHLEGLSQLESLQSANNQVTDAGLVHLQGLRQLKSLYLEGTQVTDAGLVHLEGLSQLESLYLVGTQVTDAGLVHLEGLGQLVELNLEVTQVTDAGLVHLHGLRRLTSLYLLYSKVTYEGEKKLSFAMPDCYIVGPEGEVMGAAYKKTGTKPLPADTK
jgi:hypothetical protein